MELIFPCSFFNCNNCATIFAFVDKSLKNASGAYLNSILPQGKIVSTNTILINLTNNFTYSSFNSLDKIYFIIIGQANNNNCNYEIENSKCIKENSDKNKNKINNDENKNYLSWTIPFLLYSFTPSASGTIQVNYLNFAELVLPPVKVSVTCKANTFPKSYCCDALDNLLHDFCHKDVFNNNAYKEQEIIAILSQSSVEVRYDTLTLTFPYNCINCATVYVTYTIPATNSTETQTFLCSISYITSNTIQLKCWELSYFVSGTVFSFHIVGQAKNNNCANYCYNNVDSKDYKKAIEFLNDNHISTASGVVNIGDFPNPITFQ